MQCVFNILVIFWFIIIIRPNRKCSTMVNFNHTAAGITSQWDSILPAVIWLNGGPSNCIV